MWTTTTTDMGRRGHRDEERDAGMDSKTSSGKARKRWHHGVCKNPECRGDRQKITAITCVSFLSMLLSIFLFAWNAIAANDTNTMQSFGLIIMVAVSLPILMMLICLAWCQMGKTNGVLLVVLVLWLTAVMFGWVNYHNVIKTGPEVLARFAAHANVPKNTMRT